MTHASSVHDERQTAEPDSFRLYLDGVGRHPRLTKQDEVALSQAYEAGLAAQLRLAELPQATRPPSA